MRMARNIYHRKDGRFEGRYANGYDANGKTKYSSVFGKTYAECKEKLERARSSVTAVGQSPPTGKQTVTDAVSAHLVTARHQFKPSTIGIYRRYLEKHIAPYFGKMQCRELSGKTTQDFVNNLIENGLSARTVQSVFSLLKASVQAAGDDVFKVKIPKKAKCDVDFFTVEEQKRIERAAQSSCPVDYYAVMLCLYTGIRIGEVCGLQ